jgi:hypothetical protein
MEQPKIIRSWKRSDIISDIKETKQTRSKTPPKPQQHKEQKKEQNKEQKKRSPSPPPKKKSPPKNAKSMEMFLKTYQSPQKKRDIREAKELRVASTEKERARQDSMAFVKQKVLEKGIKLNQNIKRSPSRSSPLSSSSPPASGYKYTTLMTPEQLLEEGLRKQDNYMIKNALKRGAGINFESIPTTNHLIRLEKFKQLSKDEMKELRESIFREIQKQNLNKMDNNTLNQYLSLLNLLDRRLF